MTDGDGLACRDLVASCRGNGEPSLRGVSFTLPARGLVAVYGRPGSGTSTLPAAILGEIRDVSGEITVGGSGLRAGEEAR